MRSIFILVLFGTPFLTFSQSVDTLAIAKKVDSLIVISNTLTGKGDFKKAQEVIEAAEMLALNVLGQESVGYGSCCHIHGLIFFYKGDYSESEKWYLKALAIRKKVLGVENPDYIGTLINLAVINNRKGDYEKSESFLLEAKEIFEIKLNDLKHPFYINCLMNLADLYVHMGEYDQAEPLYYKVLNIREETLGKEHPKYATTLYNLAILYMQMGDYEKAEPLFRESLEIRERALGAEHLEYIQSLGGLGSIYYQMGNYEKAEPFFLRVNMLREKILGTDNPVYGKGIFNLASLYLAMGDYEKAEPLFLESRNIIEKSLGKKNPEYVSALNNLASLYQKIGSIKKSEPFLLENQAIWENYLGTENPGYAICLLNLAVIQDENVNYEKAKFLYAKALAVTEKILGKAHPEYATALEEFANFYLNVGEYDKAEPLYRESLSIREKLLGRDHPTYAGCLGNLATLYSLIGEYEKAEPLFLESIATQKKMLGSEHSEYTEGLKNLAIMYLKKSAFEKADPLISELNSTYQLKSTKAVNYLSESELNNYTNEFIDGQDLVLSLTQLNQDKKIISTCLNNALFYKGFLLSVASQIQKISLADSMSTEKFNLKRSYLRRLSSEYAKPIKERDSANITDWEEKVNTLEKELVKTASGYGVLVEQVNWKEVKQKLRPESAAVEYVLYHNKLSQSPNFICYAALVLLPNDTTPHFIPLFEERQLQALLNRPGLSEKLILKDLYGNNPELRRLIWDPIEPLLRDVKTIYYSPSGLLHRINPGAILDESNQALSDGRQWVRLGSTRELVTGRLADRSFALSSEENSNNTLTALVYGGITYDMDSLAFARANPVGAVDSTEIPLRKDGAFSYIIGEQPDTSNTRGSSDGTWSTLAATNKEADEVSAMLTGAGFSTQKRQGFYASEEQLKQIGVNAPSPRVLHLATHGFSYPDPKKTPPKGFADSEPTYKMLDDPMLRSGLVLAGANYYWKNKRPLTNREDGVLVAYEVRDLNLRNTELAVLSACQTGLGDVVGSEGVYGLQRAFRIAGAKFLIVSLWQVPDEQTQELMRLFYQNWLEKKESLRDAFNHAQQALREKEPNPFMWAGFVLIE